MNTPPKLNDWALNVSQAYLMHHNPTTLHTTDTLAYSWKTMPFMTPMEVDDQSDWIPVSGRQRSKSPPTASPISENGSVVLTITPLSPNDPAHFSTTTSHQRPHLTVYTDQLIDHHGRPLQRFPKTHTVTVMRYLIHKAEKSTWTSKALVETPLLAPPRIGGQRQVIRLLTPRELRLQWIFDFRNLKSQHNARYVT
jgi:hypothetical protein